MLTRHGIMISDTMCVNPILFPRLNMGVVGTDFTWNWSETKVTHLQSFDRRVVDLAAFSLATMHQSAITEWPKNSVKTTIFTLFSLTFFVAIKVTHLQPFDRRLLRVWPLWRSGNYAPNWRLAEKKCLHQNYLACKGGTGGIDHKLEIWK